MTSDPPLALIAAAPTWSRTGTRVKGIGSGLGNTPEDRRHQHLRSRLRDPNIDGHGEWRLPTVRLFAIGQE